MNKKIFLGGVIFSFIIISGLFAQTETIDQPDQAGPTEQITPTEQADLTDQTATDQAGQADLTDQTATDQAGQADLTDQAATDQAGQADLTDQTATADQAGQADLTDQTATDQAGQADLTDQTATDQTDQDNLTDPIDQAGQANFTNRIDPIAQADQADETGLIDQTELDDPFAQDVDTDIDVAEDDLDDADDDGQLYVINDIDVDIETRGFLGGNTSVNNLLKRLSLNSEGDEDSSTALQKGRVFYSTKELKENMRLWRYKLENEIRVFDKGTQFTYEITDETNVLGHRLVNVSMAAKESMNVFVLPYPKYDSNNGLKLGMRLKHYNFLGSLNTLSVSGNYISDENKHKALDGDIDFVLPVFIFHKSWTVSAAVGFNYFADDEGIKYNSRIFSAYLGLATWWQLTDKLRLYTTIAEYTKVEGVAIEPSLSPSRDPYYIATAVKVALPIRINQSKLFGNLYYTPSIGARIRYLLGEEIMPARHGIFPYVNNTLSATKIKRIGNFRQGLAFKAGVYTSYDPYKAKYWGVTGADRTGLDQYAWHVIMTSQLTGFAKFNDQIGASGRIGFNYDPFRDSVGTETLGSVARGIRNYRIQGDMFFYWNVDLIDNVYLGVFQQFGEMHGHIFYDGIVVRDYQGPWQKYFHTIGAELVLYPKFSRSLSLRMSLGEDIEALIYNGNIKGNSPRPTNHGGGVQYELYLGLDMHY